MEKEIENMEIKDVCVEVECGTAAEACMDKIVLKIHEFDGMDRNKMAFEGSKLIGYVECCEDSGYIEHEATEELKKAIWGIMTGKTKVTIAQSKKD